MDNLKRGLQICEQGIGKPLDTENRVEKYYHSKVSGEGIGLPGLRHSEDEKRVAETLGGRMQLACGGPLGRKVEGKYPDLTLSLICWKPVGKEGSLLVRAMQVSLLGLGTE